MCEPVDRIYGYTKLLMKKNASIYSFSSPPVTALTRLFSYKIVKRRNDDAPNCFCTRAFAPRTL